MKRGVSTPFGSVDRREYVQAGRLELAERLLTYSGDTNRVVSKHYNLEVFAEQVYYVGKDGILVHNAYVDDALVHSGQHVCGDTAFRKECFSSR